jgi:tetratricopeptide (TPR) repeat protein
VRAREGITKYPDSSYLYMTLSEALADIGLFEEALEAIDTALEMAGETSIYLCMRGGLLMEFKRYEEVLMNEDRNLAADPKHHHSYFRKAGALMRLGRLVEAESVARQLTLNRNDKSDYWLRLAEVLCAQSKYDEALIAIDEAININPSESQNIFAKACTLYDAGRLDESIAVLRAILTSDPADTSALCMLGSALLKTHQYEESVKTASILLSIDKTHLLSHFEKGQGLLELEEFAEAIRAFQAILDVDVISDQAKSYYPAEVFKILRLHKRYEDAYAFISTAVQLRKTDASGCTEPVELLILDSRYEEAISLIRLARQNAFKSTRLDLAFCMATAGVANVDKALEELKAVWDNQWNPENREIFVHCITHLLLQEHDRHGPISVARTINRMVGHIPESAAIVNACIAGMLETLIQSSSLASPEWQSALAAFESISAQIADCEVAVAMLSVAIRFTQTSDQNVLLELPIEQRALLSEWLSVENEVDDASVTDVNKATPLQTLL